MAPGLDVALGSHMFVRNGKNSTRGFAPIPSCLMGTHDSTGAPNFVLATTRDGSRLFSKATAQHEVKPFAEGEK